MNLFKLFDYLNFLKCVCAVTYVRLPVFDRKRCLKIYEQTCLPDGV